VKQKKVLITKRSLENKPLLCFDKWFLHDEKSVTRLFFFISNTTQTKIHAIGGIVFTS